MKCTVCGSKKMFAVSLGESDASEVQAFACEECGHVDLYALKEVLEARKKFSQSSKEKESKIDVIQNKIDAAIRDLEKYENILTDENQSVKNVNAARVKVLELREELAQLEEEKDTILEAE